MLHIIQLSNATLNLVHTLLTCVHVNVKVSLTLSSSLKLRLPNYIQYPSKVSWQSRLENCTRLSNLKTRTNQVSRCENRDARMKFWVSRNLHFWIFITWKGWYITIAICTNRENSHRPSVLGMYMPHLRFYSWRLNPSREITWGLSFWGIWIKKIIYSNDVKSFCEEKCKQSDIFW